jgi:hypothetical protein
MPLARACRPTGGRRFAMPLEFGHEFLHAHRIGPKLGCRGVDSGRENRHDVPSGDVPSGERLPFRPREGNAVLAGRAAKISPMPEQFPVPDISPGRTQTGARAEPSRALSVVDG